MLMRRRRPVMRAATMAGGAALAYHAGKKVQSGRDMDAAQNAEMDALAEQQQAMAQAPAQPAGGMSQAAIDQLSQLAQLHEQGVLTDEEFAAQKAKILGG